MQFGTAAQIKQQDDHELRLKNAKDSASDLARAFQNDQKKQEE